MRVACIALICACAMGVARADAPKATVALLPLDADTGLEIYGQPVATEIARALVAGGLDVVVVDRKMAVPDRARLVVDGTIKTGKGNSLLLAARIRDRESGTVTDTLQVSAESFRSIDHAAEELSNRVLPAVKHRLAELDTATKPPDVGVTKPPKIEAPQPIALALVLEKIGPLVPLHDALEAAVASWVRRGHHTPLTAPVIDPSAVTKANAEIGIMLDVLSYQTEDLERTPSARARVHMRIANGTKIVFDRVIATDTVIGDRAHLADLVAREVLWIAEPHLRKVSAWK